MTSEESKDIFRLLAAFYPNAKQLNKQTFLAWQMVLARYPFDKVQSSVLTYVTKHKFFPDVADITGHIIPGEAPEQEQKDIEYMKRMLESMKKQEEKT